MRKPEAVKTILAVYDSIESAGSTVSSIVAAGLLPATLEMMDNLVIQAIEEHLGRRYDEGSFFTDIAGGYAEATLADERFCFPIPAGYPAEQAAPLLCAG